VFSPGNHATAVVELNVVIVDANEDPSAQAPANQCPPFDHERPPLLEMRGNSIPPS
jgi:hypothetical protein